VDVSPPSSGLLLYYPFDGNTIDASGNINNAINYTSNNYVTGKWSQALDFNGTSDYLKLTNTINSDMGLSFSFWLNTRGVNGTENNGTIIVNIIWQAISDVFSQFIWCKYNQNRQFYWRRIF